MNADVSSQPMHVRCSVCHQHIEVVPGLTPWEFEMRCGCGFAGTISWFHGRHPPKFERAELQLNLLEAQP